jgi:hypothetical protein
LHQPVKLAPKSAGLRPRIEVPQRRRRSTDLPARAGRTRGGDRSARSALSGEGARRRKCAAMRLNLTRTRVRAGR